MKSFLISIVAVIESILGISHQQIAKSKSISPPVAHSQVTGPSSSTVATTSLDASAWITYNNDQYGITFQYPSNWGTPNVQQIDDRFSSMIDIEFSEPFFRIDVGQEMNDNGTAQTPEEFFAARKASFSSSSGFTATSTILDSMSATRFSMVELKGTGGTDTTPPLAEDNVYSEIIASGVGDTIVSIDYEYPIQNGQLGNIIGDVLSTFKYQR